MSITLLYGNYIYLKTTCYNEHNIIIWELYKTICYNEHNILLVLSENYIEQSVIMSILLHGNYIEQSAIMSIILLYGNHIE